MDKMLRRNALEAPECSLLGFKKKKTEEGDKRFELQ